jgi:hypothetical protein
MSHVEACIPPHHLTLHVSNMTLRFAMPVNHVSISTSCFVDVDRGSASGVVDCLVAHGVLWYPPIRSQDVDIWSLDLEFLWVRRFSQEDVHPWWC